MTTIQRQTRETNVQVFIGEGAPGIAIDTSVPFLDHMVTTLARYASLDLTITATGDLRHHIIEDVAIAFGMAIVKHAPAARARYGERVVPMDEALVQCALDLGGRPFYEGPIPSSLYDHWMRSFADHAMATIHIRVLRGTDRHHIVEAAFKALGLALGEALTETGEIFSTKGAVRSKEG
jgi:imidazoleglycerol-phosphate dehydratase